MCLFWIRPHQFQLAICWAFGPDIYPKFTLLYLTSFLGSLLHPRNQRQDCHFPEAQDMWGGLSNAGGVTVTKMPGVRALSLCGFFGLPSTVLADASGWYWMPQGSRAPWRWLLSLWCRTLSLRLTSRFGIVLEAPPEPSPLHVFLTWQQGWESRPKPDLLQTQLICFVPSGISYEGAGGQWYCPPRRCGHRYKGQQRHMTWRSLPQMPPEDFLWGMEQFSWCQEAGEKLSVFSFFSEVINKLSFFISD